jgi:hypothetical protein
MARIRTIKPQHVNDKKLTDISLQAHLFWILSWCFSDDEGVLENDPILLKSQLFPRRPEIRTEQIIQWIDQLTKARFMIPFTHNGEGYLLHRTFNVHQKIDRPQPSKIPQETIDTIRRTLDEHSTSDQPCIVKESIVKEGSVAAGESSPPDHKQKTFKQWTREDFIQELEQFKDSYPKEVLNKFFKYWSEKSASGRMKLQMERTWETSKRLDYWINNDFKKAS